MVGTDAAWDAHWRSITKASRKVMDTLLERDDTRRLQTMALAKRSKACDWYARGLKMQFEATMRQFATNGDDVVVYSRVKETV